MPKLVIVSRVSDMKIGEVRQGLAEGPNGYGPMPNQCFRVVGKSNAQEWIDCCVSFGASRDHLEMIVDINGPWYYYEIQTD